MLTGTKIVITSEKMTASQVSHGDRLSGTLSESSENVPPSLSPWDTKYYPKERLPKLTCPRAHPPLGA